MANASGDDRNLAASPRRPAAKPSAAADAANPVARQRELGRRLRELRNRVGMTVEEVGAQLLCSATKISRLETGARRANPRDVRDLCHLYRVTDQAEADRLMELARQARQAGWWTEYEEPLFSPLLGLEQAAASIAAYSMYHVPGLLQTSDYARAIIKGIERKIHPEALDNRVEARLRRQELLEGDKPPRFRAILDEAVLRRRIGGPSVMRAQLDKMLARIRDEKVTIQIITFQVGAHASPDSNFDLFQFGDESKQRPVVFVEGLFRDKYFERPVEIARYQEALEYLRDSALTPANSTSLIRDIRNGLWS